MRYDHVVKRCVLTTLVFLALGAIVNIAVASAMSRLADRSWPMCILLSDESSVNKRCAGWPMECVYIQKCTGPSAPFFAPPVFAGVTIELHPVWKGFAFNTVFYAGILWLLLAAPFALRRRIRIRRGLCPVCAYPVGASACTQRVVLR